MIIIYYKLQLRKIYFLLNFFLTVRIYLDTNHWINLAKVHYGKETDPTLVEVYQKIKKLSDSKIAIFPISIFHLNDILKNSNKSQRDNLVDFILSISKGWSMKPFPMLLSESVENVLLQKIGAQPIHDIRSQIFGKGSAHMVSTGYDFKSDTKEGRKLIEQHGERWRERLESLESMSLFLKDESFCLDVRNTVYALLGNTALTLENYRHQKQSWTKTDRFANELQAFFYNSIEPHLSVLLRKYEIENPRKYMLQTKQDFEQFLEFMPSFNILIRLTFVRDEESPERIVQPNDLTDIYHFAESVPYCDIVVMEKMFASICKRTNLDKTYNCKVLSSLEELNVII